jgi:hypothetical protein
MRRMEMKLKRMWGVTIVTLACFVAVGAAAKSKESGTMVLHSDAVIAGSHLATGRYDVQW